MNKIINNTKINELANEYVSTLKGVNFIKLLNNRYKDKKVSIVAKYIPLKKEEYINYLDIINPSNNIKDDYYYGLSPKLSLKSIASKIKGDTFINIDKLKEYMLLNGKYFAMHNTINSRKYLEALFSRTLLKVISKYGFKLLTTKEIYLEIKELLKLDTSNLLKLNIGVEEEFKHKYYILLKGRPSKTILDTLTSKNYYFKYDKAAKRLYFTKYSGDNLDLLYKEDSIYKITLLNNAYYSGVIPRLRKIIELTDLVNTKVNSIILEVERTTFALEDSIDNTEINNLEILSTYKELLEEFDHDEDTLEKKYVYNSLETTSLDDINTYLDLSLNTKIIGVSSNVITKDGYLLIAHRNKRVVDNSTLYPSFNGHSEIYDPNVEFYNESTYEDLPTITLLNENRLDFKNEFSREMYSELSISGFEKEYNLFGLSVLGMNQELWKKNNPGKSNTSRRLHFNLLATHTSNKLMDEILSIWKDSTEAFENDFIYGIKIIKCSNVFILLKDVFLNFITLLRKSKEFIVSILTIIVAISTATFININDSIPSQILAIFNWIFLVIVLVLSITNLIYFLTKKYKYRDTKRTIYVLTKKNRDNIEYTLKKENKVLKN